MSREDFTRTGYYEKNHQVWSPPPQFIQRITIKGGPTTQTCARGRCSFDATGGLLGVSINFERSVDSMSRENQRAVHSNLCAGPCDECIPREEQRIRHQNNSLPRGRKQFLTNAVQSIIVPRSPSLSVKKKRRLMHDNGTLKRKEAFSRLDFVIVLILGKRIILKEKALSSSPSK